MKRIFETKVYELTNDHSGQHIAGVAGLSDNEFGGCSLNEVERDAPINDDTIVTVRAHGHICSFSLKTKSFLCHGVGKFIGVTSDFTLAISEEDMRVLANKEVIEDEEWYGNLIKSSAKRSLEEQRRVVGGYIRK